MTCALVLAGAVQQASALDMVSTKGVEVPTETAAYGESVARRGFIKYPKVYLQRGVVTTVLEDPNWDIWWDTSVSVKFLETWGPTECYVSIYYKEDSASEWTLATGDYLGPADSISCNIPEDYTFKVVAISSKGNDGNVKFEVSLSQ